MPRTIVVSGASSGVGKTTLATAICRLLPGAVHVKLGHGPEKKDMPNVFLPAGTPFSEVVDAAPDASFLVIESNRILEDIDPDCAIYLPGGREKSSAAAARARADITRGSKVSEVMVLRISHRLGVPKATVLEIIDAAGATAATREKKHEKGEKR